MAADSAKLSTMVPAMTSEASGALSVEIARGALSRRPNPKGEQ